MWLTASDGRKNCDFVAAANGVIDADDRVIDRDAKRAAFGQFVGEHAPASAQLRKQRGNRGVVSRKRVRFPSYSEPLAQARKEHKLD